jgi:hypothetical protein
LPPEPRCAIAQIVVVAFSGTVTTMPPDSSSSLEPVPIGADAHAGSVWRVIVALPFCVPWTRGWLSLEGDAGVMPVSVGPGPPAAPASTATGSATAATTAVASMRRRRRRSPMGSISVVRRRPLIF